MNFDDIKRKMDADKMENIAIPTNIKQLEKSKIPIQKVRQSMKGEMITQLLIIVVFFAVPTLIDIKPLPRGVYYILMLVTNLITLLYIAKMNWFLKKTSGLIGNSKDTVMAFIYDLQITLEVYKTAVISGSLLLPISLITLLLGSEKVHIGVGKIPLDSGKEQVDLFMKFISLDMSSTTLLITIVVYLLIAALIYYITVKWAEKLYGVHIDNLKETLKGFEV